MKTRIVIIIGILAIIAGVISIHTISPEFFSNHISRTTSPAAVGTLGSLSVTCRPVTHPAIVNTYAEFYAEATGGNGSYSYSWTGTDGLTNTTPWAGMVYKTAGKKSAAVTVMSAGTTTTAQCEMDVVSSDAPAIAPLAVTCSPNVQSAAVNTNVEYVAKPRGGNGVYSYSWTGTDGLTNKTQWASFTYKTPGRKTATVTVTSAGVSIANQCNMDIVAQDAPATSPLTVSCSSDKNRALIGSKVTYTAVARGGNGVYSYAWSGTDSMSGSTAWGEKVYTTPGTKSATVTVTSVGSTKSAQCSSTIVKDTVPTASLIITPTPGASSPSPRAFETLGVNIEGLADYAVSKMFADAMKTARMFGVPGEPWKKDLSIRYDQNGWPVTDFGVFIFTELPDAAGVYKLSFTGKADVKVVASDATISNYTYNSTTNFSTADITVHGSQLALSFTETKGGVKNISLMRPGTKPGDVFTEGFLHTIKHANVIRFMDYLATNDNPVYTWEQRTKKTDALQTATMDLINPITGMPPVDSNGKPIISTAQKGGAYEYIIELANLTGKDIWINIPSQANDAYVRSLAEILKRDLRSDITVYVEYSNEVWNWIFLQEPLNRAEAKKEALAGDVSLTNNGEFSADSGYTAFRRVAKRTVAISNIFREVFGASAINTRIRPILATQIANLDIAHSQLEYISKYVGDPKRYVYGLAGAPYYGFPEHEKNLSSLTVDQVISRLTRVVNEYPKTFINFSTLARSYDIKPIMYEGGSDTTGAKGSAASLQSASDERMRDLTYKYIGLWYACGGDLMMYFNNAGHYGEFGTWGLTNNVNVASPKLSGFNDVAATTLNNFQCILSDSNTASRSMPLISNPGNGNGLYGTYFSDLTLTKRAFTETTPMIAFDWTNVLPYKGVLNTFSARWTGSLAPLSTGEHTLTVKLSGADGVRLIVDGQKVIESWPVPDATTPGTPREVRGTVSLSAARTYPITVEYFHQPSYHLNTPTLILSWSTPGKPTTVIPMSQLSH